MKTTVIDEYGLCILRDASASCPEGSGLGKAFEKAPLKAAAREGSIFFIDREDPTRLKVEILVEESPNEAYFSLYEPTGGRVLLRVPTGELAVSGYGAWASGRAGEVESLAVSPGDYSVAVFSNEPLDVEACEREMERVVGPKDWRFSNRVSYYGTAGCLPVVITALAAIFVSWKVGLVIAGAVAIGWLPYFALLLSPRYRRIERARKAYEAELPTFMLRLEKVDTAEGLAGGFVR